MNRRSMLITSVPMVLAAALLPSSVVAQEKSLKDQLVGTWIFVSAQDVKPDGTKVDPWGPNPKGVAMYDAKGRFTFMIMRSDLPKFASNNRAQATAEEGKAVAQGMIAFYGTYTVNDGVLTTRIEGSSYPNLIGGDCRCDNEVSIRVICAAISINACSLRRQKRRPTAIGMLRYVAAQCNGDSRIAA